MNDFVNPQHRGVNLPEGFKDLMDVLDPKRRKPLIERYERNGLQHAEKYVLQLLESRSKCALGICHKRSLVFTLVRFPESVTASFFFSNKDVLVERNVSGVFMKFGRVPVSDAPEVSNFRLVRYVMPGNAPGILEIVCELLQRAFGALEDDGLDFIVPER